MMQDSNELDRDIADTLLDSGISEIDIDALAENERDRRILRNQQRFLAAYAVGGTVKAGLRGADVNRSTVTRWRQSDVFGFQSRFDEAKQSFCDSLEDIAMDLVKQLKPGQTPVLLITLLNANLPDKYRSGVVVADDTAKRTLDAITEAAKNSLKPAAVHGERSAIEQVTDLLQKRPSAS